MIAVDTSVWVAARRRPDGTLADTLRALLDDDAVVLPLPVRFELLAGTSKPHRKALLRGLSALPVLRPTEGTWATIESWVGRAADAGERFGLADVLIAGLAHEAGALVWSLDQDFERLAKMKLVRLY